MRGLRSLEALYRTASTSRVLNLYKVWQDCHEEDEYQDKPFFQDPMLNRAIFVKHRLRPDETYLMPRSSPVATKIIFPFDSTTLRTGGQSIMIGQSGYRQTLIDMLGGEHRYLERDLQLLWLMSRLPSLDPFLLKETLSRHDYDPADCYFAMSTADIAKMRTFAAEQIRQLITLAFAGPGNQMSASIMRMVDAILTKDTESRLDPLRITLGLDGEQFEDSIFSWKGFLYFKWQFRSSMSKMQVLAVSIDRVSLEGALDKTLDANIKSLKVRLKKAIQKAARNCVAILGLYDDAFNDLVEHGNASAFRKFLLEAPRLFIELGHSMGVMNHITSFWEYRFPNPNRPHMQASEFHEMLTEFLTSLTETSYDDLARKA
ncbi:hypothetical protein PbB2_01279 [Candidatus Phycosocius bacilliformis]|uniref:Uncharacterized protein n=1 Tax=Candidatus Phycosocius bacilliformis TaxID=1445552 RepID=A0A2P2E976_9PROT|nr:hypothetical protein [Candidatus Phycosocius bacilliformis]GBF57611.1 hypothetical protein PbB2_01279 [Candidatus Phycosocius bacilliformis]